MPGLNANQLGQYLDDYGWTYYEHSHDTLMSGWQTDKRSYPLTLNLSDTCLSLAVEPLLKLDIDWSLWPEIVRDILELNQDIQLAKLALTPEGSIVLSCQMLTKNMTYENFSDTLGIIGYYAEELYDQLFDRIFKSGLLTPHHSKFLT